MKTKVNIGTRKEREREKCGIYAYWSRTVMVNGGVETLDDGDASTKR